MGFLATKLRSSPAPGRVPLWLKLGYGVATPIIAIIYARTYGPKNFLWLSDIALAATTAAVITESPLLASMPAVGVLPLEIAWTADFLAGGKMLHLAHYMYDAEIPAGRRALSLFHLALPPTLLWLMHRLGYDRRALPLQTALTLAVLPVTHAITEPAKNINWTYGPGNRPQRRLPPLLYLALEMAVIPALVIWPTHKILSRVLKIPGAKPQFSVQGHRGARGLFPENTLAGFTQAIALGVDAVELDIAITRDGVPVVSHEPRLNPDITRDAAGAWINAPGKLINAMTVAELRGYDVGRIKPGTAYAAAFPAQQPQDGAEVPTLAEVFALDGEIRFAVELKTFPDQPARTVSPKAMADSVLAVADRAGVTQWMVVFSFDWRALRHLRRVRPDVALGWLTKAQPDEERRLWWDGAAAADFGGSVARAVAAEGARLWIPQFQELDEAAVATAHEAGMKVIPWDVTPEFDLANALAMQVDGIITDRPDIALKLLAGSKH